MHQSGLKSLTPLIQGLLLLTCLTILLAGLHMAAPLVNQVLLALFLAVMLDPLIERLEKHGLPRLLTSLSVIVALLLLIVIIISSLSASAPGLIQLSRLASVQIATQLHALTFFLSEAGIFLSTNLVLSFIDTSAILRLITSQLSLIPGMLSWWLMVFLMLLFMLYELPVLKTTLRTTQHRSGVIRALLEGIQSVIVYARVKTLTGLLGGLVVWAAAWLLGLKFAFLWGMLMFIFNYVPVVGSLLAAIPPVLQTMIFFDIQAGLLVAGFFVVLNLSLRSVMEPLMLGKRLNLPLTVQLLAFLIWQALLGITGAILAIPLTFLLKKVWQALRELE